MLLYNTIKVVVIKIRTAKASTYTRTYIDTHVYMHVAVMREEKMRENSC